MEERVREKGAYGVGWGESLDIPEPSERGEAQTRAAKRVMDGGLTQTIGGSRRQWRIWLEKRVEMLNLCLVGR